MLVASILSEPARTISPETTIQEALGVMEHDDIRHLPILEGERLVGLVSDRDLVSSAPDARNLPVATLMQSHLSVVTKDDDLAALASALVEGRMGCTPVVEDDRLVGIVSELDVARAYADAVAAGASELAPHAEELMTEGVYLAPPTATVEETLTLSLDLSIRHLPVVEDGRLVGIVSDRDLRRAAAADGEGGALTPLTEVMQTDVVSILPETSAQMAARLMAQAKLSCLPVERDGVVLGILTLTDILDHASRILRVDGA